MFTIKARKMSKIVKKDGYVYLYENIHNNETWFCMGKDFDSEVWADEINEINNKLNNKE